MPRKVKDTALDTRTARDRLKARPEPYWRLLEQGLHLGYRRHRPSGVWVARRRKDDVGPGSKYIESKLGLADDAGDADGVRVMSFAQAQAAARKWARDANIAAVGGVDASLPYSVNDALDAYLSHYVTEGGKAERAARRAIETLIRPVVGHILLVKLSHAQVKQFRDGLAETGRGYRTKKGSAPRFEKLAKGNAEQLRKRRATANRIFTFLRAALNLALQQRRVATNAAWIGIKPFKNVDEPRVRYLSDAEAKRLANASAPDMRRLITAALLTGCRFGELVRMRAGDFDLETGSLNIPITKSGKPRHIVLTDEGRTFLTHATAGKAPTALAFLRANGLRWNPTDQARPLRAASKAAKISPAVSFHVLRHSYASRLARAGVPMAVIAAQLGHADLRMTARHYAHLSPSYVADTVRAAFGSMGLVEIQPGNVASIDEARTKQPARGGSAKVVKIRNER